jgi:hypothetical protein
VGTVTDRDAELAKVLAYLERAADRYEERAKGTGDVDARALDLASAYTLRGALMGLRNRRHRVA